jgi:hypothetical protein
MAGTNCDFFTHNQSRSYLNHLVLIFFRKIEENIPHERQRLTWKNKFKKILRKYVANLGVL